MKPQMIMIAVACLILGGALGFSLAPGGGSSSSSAPNLLGSSSGSCSAGGEGVGPLIQVDGEKYELADLPTDLRSRLYEFDSKRFQQASSSYKEFALRMLIAKEKGKPTDRDNLPKLDEMLSAGQATERQAKAFFNTKKSMLPPGAKFEDLKAQIISHLSQNGMGEKIRSELKKYEGNGKLKLLISAPVAPQVNINLDGLPTQGPKNAKIVLVEASDYTCGHCQHFHPEVKKLIEKNKDKIRFVQANFALRPNGKSGAYVRGAFCAQKQSEEKFWVYHDEAYKKAQNHSHAPGDTTTPEDEATEVAKNAGLDLNKFTSCLGSLEAKNFIKEKNEMLSAVGVTGTPTFFVNNRKINVGQEGLEKALAPYL